MSENKKQRKHWFLQKPEKPVFWMMIIALLLAGTFIWIIHDDWMHYRKMIPEILKRLNLEDERDLQGTFGSVVLFRACILLIPAILLGFCAFAMHYSDHKKPKGRKKTPNMKK